MQPHWVEPEPLGDERFDLMKLPQQPQPVRLPVRYDPGVIQRQIRTERTRLCGSAPSGLHKAMKYGVYLAGGAVGIFALVKAGQYINKNKNKKTGESGEDQEDLEELEEDELEPGMADGEPVEVEAVELDEEDEDEE